MVTPAASRTPRPPAPTAEAARLGHVDTLRLVAAALVVLQHFGERLPGRLAHGLVMWGPGVAGVVLFFLISGYVIPFSVRRGLDGRQFALRRLLRIYPLFLAVMALVACLGIFAGLAPWGDLASAGPLRWAANLLLVQDYLGVRAILGVSWTLSIELAWYALFAATLLAFGHRGAGLLALAVPAALVGLALLSLAMGQRIPLGRPGLVHAAVLGWQVWRWQDGQLATRALAGNVALFLGVTWLTAAVSFGVFTHPRLGLLQVLGPWTLATALFLLVTCPPRLSGSPLLARGLLPRIGAASYSVYLLHPVAAALAHACAPGAYLPAALALTALLASAGYLGVERPGIALARRLTAGPRATEAPARAPAPSC